MPDDIFAVPRLAQIYDLADDDRSDLDHYVAMVEEFGATTVLDIGCGTGTLACMLAGKGIDVIGLDPAEASLDVARSKPGATDVRWIHGDASTLAATEVAADVATMTGNVAQVFLEDADWATTLGAIAAALTPGGRFVFETRIPDDRAWKRWTPERTRRSFATPTGETVEGWVEVTDVAMPLLSFRHTYRFSSDGAELTSDSTLRFRDLTEIENSLRTAGLTLREIREAPDRPGREWVVVAETD